jgi:3-oxoacyl-[acyl-carrier protein] reductase
MQLEGKVALVTGSGRNIGRAIALALARDGADVVVNVRSNRQEAESVAAEVGELGSRKAVPLLAAVGDRGQVEKMLEQALTEFGHIDIVVNKTPPPGPTSPLRR